MDGHETLRATMYGLEVLYARAFRRLNDPATPGHERVALAHQMVALYESYVEASRQADLAADSPAAFAEFAYPTPIPGPSVN